MFPGSIKTIVDALVMRDVLDVAILNAAERGDNLQISHGKTRNVPTCVYGLMISHVTVKEHVTPLGGVVGLQSKIVNKMWEKCL